MPLVRFQVKNESALGHPELYKGADKDDPKAVLDGVAVAGLVGILRQLGDLAEFAAEVFHGLQEEVMNTASRSHKLRIRVQQIEAALPPLEKAVLSQTSHIHFAYTTGTKWHPRIQNEKNHFIYNDLPQFMMDPYEECRVPPPFNLLDRFDMGGPGSCLKRYSDPTFFKRASGVEADADKVQRDKKARKKKKKRSSRRNGELSRAASMYNHSGRMQFTPIVNENDSSSVTASAVDMEMKYDMQDNSKEFDLGTGPEYIDCVLDVSSPVYPEEHEPQEVSPASVQNSKGCIIRQPQVADYNFSDSSPQEQIARSSSCVTWDEKVEIVESGDRNFDRDEVSDMIFDLDTQERQLSDLRCLDQMNTLLNGSPDADESVSSKNQVDETESEPDNFEDALNTIESESDIDTEYRTKREVEHYSSDVKDENREDGVNVPEVDSREHHASKGESDAESNILPDTDPSESLNVVQILPPFCSKSLDSDRPPSADLFMDTEILHDPKAEPVATQQSSSGSRATNLHDPQCDTLINSEEEFPEPHPEISSVPSVKIQTNDEILQIPEVESINGDPSSSAYNATNTQDPHIDMTVDNDNESPKPHTEIATVPSFKIWTNGGLLGLMPSKPPDFAIRSTSGDTVGPPNHVSRTGRDGLTEKLGPFDKGTGSIGKTSGTDSSHTSDARANIDAKVEKHDASCSSSPECAYEGNVSRSKLVHNGNKVAVNPNVNSKSVEYREKDDAAMFGLGHRLLVNSFDRSISLNNGIESKAAKYPEASVLDQRTAEQTMPYHKILKGQSGDRSPASSLTSSPPLELMKISFNPIDAFETSKLKLKFPDGAHSLESNRDLFPSFQLVPEPNAPMRGIASDSDDDTFCRSSPYLSDDCLSNYSESDSDQWESGETPEQSDPDLYNALCRMSSMEAVSSSLHDEKAANNGISISRGLHLVAVGNSTEPSPSLDLPSFDAINQVSPGKTNSNSFPNNSLELQNYKEPDTTPLPPPLPPAEWRAPTTPDSAIEGEQTTLTESLRHEFDLKLLVSTVSDKPKSPSDNQQKMREDADADADAFKMENKQLDQPKSNKLGGANRSMSCKLIEEKDDFLHQIRSKSFNLRPTVPAKPTGTSGPTANNKVTAILEKANAIRQAVGSDDGEDDDSNWSDS